MQNPEKRRCRCNPQPATITSLLRCNLETQQELREWETKKSKTKTIWHIVNSIIASVWVCYSGCRTPGRIEDKTPGSRHFPGKPYTRKCCFTATFLLYINGGVGLLFLWEAWTSLLKWLTCGQRFKQPVCTLTSHSQRWSLKKEEKRIKQRRWSDLPFSSRPQQEAHAIFYSLMSGGFRQTQGRPQSCLLPCFHQGQLDEK